jgi:hypothetical protein
MRRAARRSTTGRIAPAAKVARSTGEVARECLRTWYGSTRYTRRPRLCQRGRSSSMSSAEAQ